MLVLTVALALSTSQAARADNYFTQSYKFNRWINGKDKSLTPQEKLDAIRAKGLYIDDKEDRAWGDDAKITLTLTGMLLGITGAAALSGIPELMIGAGLPPAVTGGMTARYRLMENRQAQRYTVRSALKAKLHVPAKVVKAFPEVWANDPDAYPVAQKILKADAGKQASPSIKTASVAQRSGNQPHPTGVFQKIRNAVGKLGRR